jgi:hypothetical protein
MRPPHPRETKELLYRPDHCIMGLFRETERECRSDGDSYSRYDRRRDRLEHQPSGIGWSGTCPSDYRTIGNHQRNIIQELDRAS